jgi:hypothetical protein
MLEGPLSKITNAERANAFARKVASRHSFLGDEFVEDEYWWFKYHLDSVFTSNGTTADQFAESVEVCSGLRVGVTDTSLKLQFIPNTEDYLHRTSFAEQGGVYRANLESSEVSIFTDRNGFV